MRFGTMLRLMPAQIMSSAISRRWAMRPGGSPRTRARRRQRTADTHSRDAALAPLPPSGSTAGSALSPTPPQGGSDTRASCAGLKNHSPLEGESQKPSRQAKADAEGGPTNTRYLAHSTSVPALRSPPLRGSRRAVRRRLMRRGVSARVPQELRDACRACSISPRISGSSMVEGMA